MGLVALAAGSEGRRSQQAQRRRGGFGRLVRDKQALRRGSKGGFVALIYKLRITNHYHPIEWEIQHRRPQK